MRKKRCKGGNDNDRFIAPCSNKNLGLRMKLNLTPTIFHQNVGHMW